MSHVSNIKLGRRNFHYLLSNLVLEDEWESDIAEYGVVNVTGLKLFNEDRGEASRYVALGKLPVYIYLRVAVLSLPHITKFKF